MRSIGEMARESGLGVSALRFYDRAGVLVPAWVDPVSGYRWYTDGQLDEARLLVRLRRAGMPLTDIRLITAGWTGADSDLVRHLLDAHLRRLEQGLATAREEFSALRSLLATREKSVTTTETADRVRRSVPAGEFAAAIDAVRFAVSTDRELPVLGGVLFDIEGDVLHAVATDRYRMAVARAAADGGEGGGGRVQVVVPAALVDAMRALSAADEPVRLTVDGGRVTLEAGDRQAAGQAVPHDFPDYRRLLPPDGGRRATVDVAAFRRELEDGPVRSDAAGDHELSVLKVTVTGDGATVGLCADAEHGTECVAVNRAYLLEALAAAGRDRLDLELGAPTTPVAIRRPDDTDTYSLLMPVRLED